MYYLSARITTLGVVGDQYLLKHIPDYINPIVSIIGLYIIVQMISGTLLPPFPPEGGLNYQVIQLNWLQIALAISIIMGEAGYLLMFRFGWNLSSGNFVTGMLINLVLIGLGVTLLGEKITLIKVIAIVSCIQGVALIRYRS